MGASGRSLQGSKSYLDSPVSEIRRWLAGDINGDCGIDFKDLAVPAVHGLDGRHALN
jgi:hypothetical protein